MVRNGHATMSQQKTPTQSERNRVREGDSEKEKTERCSAKQL